VTGWANTSNSTHAFLYSNGTMYNLNTLIGNAHPYLTLSVAYGINDAGQIVAEGFNSRTSEDEAVLLSISTVPEPGTLALTALGLVLLGLRLAQRRRGVMRA
jgi:probable HAF family extracellular repeat protein